LAYSDLARIRMELVPLPGSVPRNAIPSLHMTWALQIWWMSRDLGRPAKLLGLVFVLITLMDTLGTGQHYLVDLAVSLPFTAMMQALCARSVPLRTPSRMVPAITGALMVAAWFATIRYGIPLLLKSPVIPWALVVLTIATSLYLLGKTPTLFAADVNQAAERASAR